MRLLASAVAAVFLLSGCGVSLSSGDQQGYVSGDGSYVVISPEKRKDPVERKGELVGGGRAALSDYRGKIVVMPVWGSWCPPCRTEAPMLEEEWRKLSQQGVQFLGVNTRQDDPAQRAAFIRNKGITYPSFDNPDGSMLLKLARGLGPKTIPATIFFDTEGRVAGLFIGEISRSTLNGMIEDIRA